MISFTGEFFDAKSSHPYPVSIHLNGSFLTLIHTDFSLDIPLKSVQIDPFVGSARIIIYLPNGAEIHSSNRDEIEKLERFIGKNSPEKIALHLENKFLYALLSLIITIGIIVASLRFGLPAVAHYTASILSPDTEKELAIETLNTLDNLYLHPSVLSPRRQHEVTQQLDHFCSIAQCPPHQLLFRNSSAIGANAFALPSNMIVITDQLIQKSKHDEEIIAVLAHELGHVKEKHILRMMLQSVGSTLILVAVTGDLTDFYDLVAGIPVILLQQGYSRDMEDEADTFALNALIKADIAPHRFADILMRIDPHSKESATLFSSHPDTSERIKPFLKASKL